MKADAAPGFVFHAAAPDGHWINDPNGLVHAGGRWRLGSFDGARFEARSDQPLEGRPLDLGPDFQVAMCDSATNNSGGGGTGGDRRDERLIVGWAANWTTAGRVRWPGGGSGGPISLPRRLSLDAAAGRLRQAPLEAAAPLARLDRELVGGEPFALEVRRGASRLTVQGDPATGDLVVTRVGADPALNWTRRHLHALGPARRRRLQVFIDGPLVEAFISPDGAAITAALDGEGEAQAVVSRALRG